jgi:hypothetical protein
MAGEVLDFSCVYVYEEDSFHFFCRFRRDHLALTVGEGGRLTGHIEQVGTTPFLVLSAQDARDFLDNTLSTFRSHGIVGEDKTKALDVLKDRLIESLRAHIADLQKALDRIRD